MNISRLLLLCATLFATSKAAMGDDESPVGVEFFEKRIRPVLVRSCYECHSAASAELKGGLRVDSRDLIRKGGDSGPAVVPGNTSQSLLLEAIRHESLEMPPDQKLPDRVIADFETWIQSGAPDPRDRPPSAEEVSELSWRSILDERRDWWSLQPLAATTPPVIDGSHADHPIDAFIVAKHQSAGVSLAPPAAARIIARRLSLVLTGLPPRAAEIEQFAAAYQTNPDAAYRALVDRLIDSPHFGEHWARHWMDVVRFAETHGYEWNHEIRDAWRYRDYLIRAFNSDVPYDQLVREHIAGDLLETPRINEQLGINESVIGTAFWRFGELGHDDCVEFPEIRFDALDNQIDTFAKAFQGLTISCARCHDHKVDAISTKDYYALVGILESSIQVVHTLDSPQRVADAVAEIEQLKRRLRQRLGDVWLAAMDQSRESILEGIRSHGSEGDGSTRLSQYLKSKTLDYDDPGFVLHRVSLWDQVHAFQTAKWIWDRPDADRGEPEPTPRYFRFSFQLSELPAEALLYVTADDRATASVNGHALGTNEQWTHPGRYDLTPSLTVGRNTIAVEAANVSGPAGLLATVVIDGRKLSSSSQWKASRELAENWTAPGFNDSNWAAATELGPASMLPWRLVVNEDLEATWQALQEEFVKEQDRRARSNAENFEVWVDFGSSAASNWSASGLGLSNGPSRAGEFTLTQDGDQIVELILPAGLYTNTASNRLNGSLRSPWLPTTKKFVSLQLVGNRRSMVRPVVDSCALNEFAGGGLEYLVGGMPRWKQFPTTAGDSHRSFIEFTTRADNPRWPDRPDRAGTKDPAQLADRRSSFGVMRAVLHDSPTPPHPELIPVLALFEEPIPSDVDDIVSNFQAVARRAVAAWKEDRATDTDVHWINWLLNAGLLSNSATGDPQLRELLDQYRHREMSLPEPRVVAGLADHGTGRSFPVLKGGDPLSPGAVVPRRYIEVVSDDPQSFRPDGSGRLELAERIASSDNPLTARVMVNRVWHHLFGRGLVATPDDFGGMGETPTHPELLDFLAAEFVNDGWSLKKLIRRIVLTSTFRQSSFPATLAAEVDPANQLLHHYPARRLDAESVRDTILAVSGRLDRKLFGPSIHPYRKEEKDYRKLWRGPLDGDGRRSVYIKVTRMEGPQFLELFDFPNPMASRGRRDRTNVPAQALALLNDPFVIDQAQFWSERLVMENHASIEERVEKMFRQALGRPPSKRERQRFVRLIRELGGAVSTDASLLHDKQVWQDAAHAMFNMKELIYIR